MPLKTTLDKINVRTDLTADEAEQVFNQIFGGTVPKDQIAALLLGLRAKGEKTPEILGAVRSMRANMRAIQGPADSIDIVGTGGDGHGTLNVSTAAALVVAGCGVSVAKHGNRAATSLSGSSDTLGKLGINLEPAWEVLEKCLNEVGIAFLFAPRHHPAMRHVAEVRRELGVRTIFNLLGPMTNPANVKRHMIGVYDSQWLRPMAEVLKSMGSERAWFVHGEGRGKDGLDELSTVGPTNVVELTGGSIDQFTVSPESVNLPRATLEDIKGGDADKNADAIRHLLAGKKGAYRDIVLLNAAAALVVAGKAGSVIAGLGLARQSIDTGAAAHKLDQLIKTTNASPHAR